jgi:hypothetical protein
LAVSCATGPGYKAAAKAQKKFDCCALTPSVVARAPRALHVMDSLTILAFPSFFFFSLFSFLFFFPFFFFAGTTF